MLIIDRETAYKMMMHLTTLYHYYANQEMFYKSPKVAEQYRKYKLEVEELMTEMEAELNDD